MPHAARARLPCSSLRTSRAGPRGRRGGSLQRRPLLRPLLLPAEGDAAAAAGDEPAGHRRHARGAVGAAGDRGPELRHVRGRGGRTRAQGSVAEATWAPAGRGRGSCCRDGRGSAPVPGSTVGLRAVKAVTLRDRSPGPVGVGAVVPGGPQPVCPLCQGSLLMSSVQHSAREALVGSRWAGL